MVYNTEISFWYPLKLSSIFVSLVSLAKLRRIEKMTLKFSKKIVSDDKNYFLDNISNVCINQTHAK